MIEMYLDYDYDSLQFIKTDFEGLSKIMKIYGFSARVDVYKSSEGNYHARVKFNKDASFEFAAALMLLSKCSLHYKRLVFQRESFTIRVSEEVSGEGVKMKPELVDTWYVGVL